MGDKARKHLKDIYDFVDMYTMEKGFSPSIREICEGTGLSSTASAKMYVEKLRNFGLVTYVEEMPRTIRIAKPFELPEIRHGIHGYGGR